jgi:hypothetical protein
VALTVTNTHQQLQALSVGNVRGRLVTVTFDASYAAGGESFTPADVGLSEFYCVIPSVDANANLPYVVQYDYTAQKLQVFGVEQDADASTTEPLDEENAAADLSSLVVRVFCLGA